MPVNVTTLVNGAVRPPSLNIGGKGARAAKSIAADTDRALDQAAYKTAFDYKRLMRTRGFSNFTVRGTLYVGKKRAAAAAAQRRISRPVRAIYMLPKQAEYLSRQILGGLGSRRISYVKAEADGVAYRGHVIAPEGQRGRKLGGLVRRLKRTSGIAARSARLSVRPRRDGGDGFVVRERGRFRAWVVPRTFYRPRLSWAAFLQPQYARHARVAMEKAHRRSVGRLARGLLGVR